MALVFALSTGDDFYVGTTRVTCEEINTATTFKLRVHRSAIDHDYWITGGDPVEILPGVTVNAGPKGSPMAVKASINAPRNIQIDRGSVYREKHGTA